MWVWWRWSVGRQLADILAALQTVIRNQEKADQKMTVMDDKVTKLREDMAAERTVIDSAIAYAKGVPQLIADAVAKAIEAGATPEQLQAVTDLQAASEAQASDLAAAIPQNTVAATG